MADIDGPRNRHDVGRLISCPLVLRHGTRTLYTVRQLSPALLLHNSTSTLILLVKSVKYTISLPPPWMFRPQLQSRVKKIRTHEAAVRERGRKLFSLWQPHVFTFTYVPGDLSFKSDFVIHTPLIIIWNAADCSWDFRLHYLLETFFFLFKYKKI